MAYSNTRSITIDHTKAGSSDSTSWPMLFTGTFAYLATVAHGGALTSASGFDCVFTSDAAGTTLLAFERVMWIATTGQCVFNVKIPTLSHSADTVIYLQYGNAAVTTDQSNASGVYSNNFVSAAHVIDITGGNCDLVDPFATWSHSLTIALIASGPFINAANFAGRAFSTSGPTPPAGSAVRTISVWFNMQGSSATEAFGGWGAASSNNNFSPAFVNPNLIVVTNFGTNQGFTFATDSAWHFLVCTLPSGTTMSSVLLYLDGVLQTSSGGGAASVATTGSGLTFGQLGGSTSIPLSGTYAAEQRVASVARSQDWITAEFNNQNAPGSFYTIGSPGPPPGGLLLMNPGMDGGMRPQLRGGTNG